MNYEPDDESEPDGINRADGLERHWLFYNGEWAETIFGTAAGIGGVFWSFLFVLGYSRTILAYVLAGVAIVGLLGWNLFFRAMQDYERTGWRKRSGGAASSDMKKLVLAICLWAFILLFLVL